MLIPSDNLFYDQMPSIHNNTSDVFILTKTTADFISTGLSISSFYFTINNFYLFSDHLELHATMDFLNIITVSVGIDSILIAVPRSLYPGWLMLFLILLSMANFHSLLFLIMKSFNFLMEVFLMSIFS